MSILLMLLSMGALFGAVFFLFQGIYEYVTTKGRDHVFAYAEYLHAEFDRMFMDVSVQRCRLYVVGSLGLGILLGFYLVSAQPFASWGWTFLRLVLMVAFGIIGWKVPRWVVGYLWNRRVDKFDEQMLDALTLMSNALKAGLSFLQSMDTVVREMPVPVSQEFGLVFNQTQLGSGVEDALHSLETRMKTEDTQIVVTAVVILRETGGNLSDTFDTIAYTIRERRKVKGRIAALTTQGIMQGIIIFVMPFVLGAILFAMNPEALSRMWTTAVGWILLIFMMILQGVGGVLMKKMVTIRV